MKTKELNITVEKQLKVLFDISEVGLPNCYTNVNKWLYDFYADFSWLTVERIGEIKSLLSHPDFNDVAKAFQAKVNFDIADELDKAVLELTEMLNNGCSK